MNDNELDDLFRSNADYLADQPTRDFDQGAFWQQMQTALPKKADRQKKPFVWGWAAATLLLAGGITGIWWMKSDTGGKVEKIAQKAEGTPSKKNQERMVEPWSVPPQPGIEKPIALNERSTNRVFTKKEKNAQRPPDTQGIAEVPTPGIKQPLTSQKEQPEGAPLPQSESLPVAENQAVKRNLETIVPPTSQKSPFRVVHINEIRERKQQEAKARTRIAFRVGLPAASRVTTQSDHEAPLSIPIQN